MPCDGAPPLGRLLFITEGTGRIEQHHTSAVLLERCTSRQGSKAPEGIAGNHRGTSDALPHIGHQLVAPEGAAIGQLGWLGTAAKTQQVDRVHGMGFGQHGNVVSPVVGGRPKTMNQQQRRTITAVLLGLLMDRVDSMSEVAPAVGVHNEEREARC